MREYNLKLLFYKRHPENKFTARALVSVLGYTRRHAIEKALESLVNVKLIERHFSLGLPLYFLTTESTGSYCGSIREVRRHHSFCAFDS